MATPYAVKEDVAVLYRPLSGPEEAMVTALLEHASAMLRARFPNLDQKIADGDIDATQAKVAVVNMVLRVIRNPGGLKSETVGPFSRSWDTGSGSGLLQITDAETALFGIVGGTAPKVGSISLNPALGFQGGYRNVRSW